MLQILFIYSALAGSLDYKQEVATKIAVEHGVNPYVVLAIIETESSFNEKAVGGLGEVGLMQLRPEMHKCATFNIEGNIKCGVKYLKMIQEKKKKEYPCGWYAFYNAGPYRKLQAPRKTPYARKINRILGRAHCIN